MKTLSTIFLIILLFTVISCRKPEVVPDSFSDLPEKSAELISANNQFGLELFQKVLASSKVNENTMVSPLSVAMALSMTYNGANGQTKTDMEKTLKLYGLTMAQINNSHKALLAALKSADPDVLFEIANAIYYRQGLQVETDFVTLNKNYYQAEVSALDFNSPNALKTINGWVATKTRDKIPTIIDQIDPDLVMMLLNAIYFNGKWKNKFDENSTHNLNFTHGDGANKEVATMKQETSLEYSSNTLFSAVNLPYGKGQYQMTVILPNENKTTKDVISELSNEKWKTWMQSFKTESNVVVTMPRFKFSWEMKLNQVLKAMGMDKAFAPYVADFTGIAKNSDLYIGFVIHKTYVDVNENGTEAAAVTAVGMMTTSMPAGPAKIYFNVKRPFLYAITEKTTGAILFIGQMNAPEYK